MKLSVKENRSKAMTAACAALERGEVIGMPTETVYGLAADATNKHAVQRIFSIKRRPSFNPLICHCSDIDMAARLAHFDPVAKALAEACWPGPLTLVLPMREDAELPSITTAGLKTVAIRVPSGVSSDLIKAFGKPLAAPSANISGKVSATSADHVIADLGDVVGLVLDDGPTSIGVESTILKVACGEVHLLRSGGLTVERIAAATGIEVLAKDQNQKIVAPGMMESHYAPNAAVRLNAVDVRAGEVLLTFGPTTHRYELATAILHLSLAGDLEESARNLYAMLKAADEIVPNGIAVMPIPEVGIGIAINDRLRRAAAPRP
ncbi:L-threonylcarbamoyladenylate synthase (plasmid) [Agrobacterium tumefaciens]|uniref:L-threonylcarbamoyladenylate synthase n=1 Tax=Agrobacterium tumefaciens TaxID=358 RepID=UPI000E0A4D02|nr:L-threonylcarbamoyladenylate synthase [Agrobacterium tumefaciens]WQE43322.1 L-threonylcarbamoyladenylate synthase [Agrobacterium tumefaciens]